MASIKLVLNFQPGRWEQDGRLCQRELQLQIPSCPERPERALGRPKTAQPPSFLPADKRTLCLPVFLSEALVSTCELSLARTGIVFAPVVFRPEVNFQVFFVNNR